MRVSDGFVTNRHTILFTFLGGGLLLRFSVSKFVIEITHRHDFFEKENVTFFVSTVTCLLFS